jgi:hypothetical protein
MKKTVIFDEFNEIDLKPSDLLSRYIELTEKDVRNLLASSPGKSACACPGCRSSEERSSFARFGLNYIECGKCRTLYVSPRPDDTALENYFRHSDARTFWRGELSKLTQKKRKEKIIKPRFEWIVDSTEEYLPGAGHIADINTDQYGYLEEMVHADFFQQKTLIRPYLAPNDLFPAGSVNIVRNSSDTVSLKGTLDVVTLFEVADRTSDVERLFSEVHDFLKKGGLCFMTGILISGFDLQILWDKAENIFPPDRLNIFSVEGLNLLFERSGFECLEFSTPGILDVEIVRKALENESSASIPRFIEYLIRIRNEGAGRSFQEFLQSNLLSSYGRVVLRKI